METSAPAISKYRNRLKIKLDRLEDVANRRGTYQAIREWRDAVLADLGGPEHLSQVKQTLVEEAARTHALLEHSWCWLLTQETLPYGKDVDLLRWLAELHTLQSVFITMLCRIGLERRPPRQIKTVEELAAKYAKGQPPA